MISPPDCGQCSEFRFLRFHARRTDSPHEITTAVDSILGIDGNLSRRPSVPSTGLLLVSPHQFQSVCHVFTHHGVSPLSPAPQTAVCIAHVLSVQYTTPGMRRRRSLRHARALLYCWETVSYTHLTLP